MDTIRYVVAVLLVTFLPPALLWWFALHPFVAFWRRVGMRRALTIVSGGAVAAAAALLAVRDRLLMTDLGTRPALVELGAALLAVADWIAVKRKELLTLRILVGVPGLEAGDRSGKLLTRGIYGTIRHPRYVEVAIGSLAYAVFSNYLGAYVVAVVALPLLHAIVRLEERELAARFGAEYEEYRRRLPRYVPRRRVEYHP